MNDAMAGNTLTRDGRHILEALDAGLCRNVREVTKSGTAQWSYDGNIPGFNGGGSVFGSEATRLFRADYITTTNVSTDIDYYAITDKGKQVIREIPLKIERALLAWLNNTGLVEAARWIDEPDNDAAKKYATVVLSLCATLPDEAIDQLDPKRWAVLNRLRKLA